MTHFRFRYKRIGFMRWRCRTARYRAGLLFLPLAIGRQYAPSRAAWRRTIPPLLPPTAAVATVLQVGAFVVGAEGDPNLSGHPDIRH
jgi:hypothetical protein